MAQKGDYYVAIIGGAVAGSVAAAILAEHGIRVAVIEQNKRPYGKIEDGLPRWHVAQRKKEYELIAGRINKPGISFVPCTKLGSDISFEELTQQWGFTAVILANGAWRDRSVGVDGSDEYINKGLVYQNPFIYWYNHKNEKTYDGPRYEAPDEALVLGGGLASIDVVKVLQLENYEKALRARGIHAHMHDLEKKGIAVFCKSQGIDPLSLGVKGCLLIYRRRIQDMPLAQPPEKATPEQIAKTESVRLKVLKLAQEKFLFRFQDRRITQGIVIENGRLVGLKVSETLVEGRKASAIPGTEHELRAPLIVSSIGSIPEFIPGVVMKGEYYDYKDWDMGQYAHSERVFGVGNVVTGQGNIRLSMVHSQRVANRLIQEYIGVGEDGRRDLSGMSAAAEARGTTQAAAVKEKIKALPALTNEQLNQIDARVRERQMKVGYSSDYNSWIAKVTPPDLE